MNLRLRLLVWRLRRDRERHAPPPTTEDRERLAADLEEALKELRIHRLRAAALEREVPNLVKKCRKAGGAFPVSFGLLDMWKRERYNRVFGWLAGGVCIVGLLLQNPLAIWGGLLCWLGSRDMRGKYLR